MNIISNTNAPFLYQPKDSEVTDIKSLYRKRESNKKERVKKRTKHKQITDKETKTIKRERLVSTLRGPWPMRRARSP